MAIVIRFIAETKSFLDGVDRAIQKTELFSKKSVEEFRAATLAAGKWAAGAAAAMGVASAAIVKSSATSANEIIKLSHAANASTEEFQKYAHAAKNIGIENDAFSDILKDVTERVGEFAAVGAGPMTDFFDRIGPKIGVTIKDFRNLSGPQALQLYYDSLEKANLSQQDMTFFLESMASDVTALIPLLKDGGKAFSEQATEAEELGLVISQINLERLDDLDDSFERIADKAVGAKNEIATQLLPIVEALTKEIEAAAKNMGSFENEIRFVMDVSVGLVGWFLDSLRGVKVAFAGLGVIGYDFLATIQWVFTESAKAVAYWVDEAVSKINLVIKNLNTINPFGEIPLVDTVTDSDFMKGIRASQAETMTILGMMREDFQALVMQEMPSVGLKRFVDDAIRESNRLANEVNDSTDEDKGNGLDPFVDEEKIKKEQDLEKQRQRDKLAILREGLIAEEEIAAAKFATDIERLQEHLENTLITQEEYENLAKIKTQEFTDEITEIRKRANDAQLQHQDQFYSDLTSLMASGSKKAQKIGQAAAIVQAVQKGWSSAVSAWEAGMSTGGPFAPAVAAAYTAASLAKTGMLISNIRSGSKASGGSGGGGAVASAGSAPPPQRFDVSVSGFNPNQAMGMNQMGGVMDFINTRIRAGETFGGFSY